MTQRNTTAQEPSDTGGSAFPWTDCAISQDGMTLLDYFAGQALSLTGVHQSLRDQQIHSLKQPDTAKFCYDIAAAMLVEKRRRERPPATAQGKKL